MDYLQKNFKRISSCVSLFQQTAPNLLKVFSQAKSFERYLIRNSATLKHNKEPSLLSTPQGESLEREHCKASTWKSRGIKTELAGCAPNRGVAFSMWLHPLPPLDSWLRPTNRPQWTKHAVSPRQTVRDRKHGLFLPWIQLWPTESP